MTNNIVTVNVTQQVAPAPSNLQQKGAFISQGGTTKPSSTITFLTQLSDLTSILTAPAAITSITWASSVVTVTTSAPHGITVADTILGTIAGVSPAGYNGTFTFTSTGASTFTYPLASNPGTETVLGTWVPENAAELNAMATTFFAQGSQQGVYVLELGLGSATDGVTTLTTWITNNPNTLYAYLVPRYWDGVTAFLTLLASYESLTSKTYFYITTTSGTYTDYTALMKCAVTLVEASGIPATEFSLAAEFWQLLSTSPSAVNKVAPFAFRFLFGVTPYPLPGNQTLLAAFKAAGVNVIGTGAEGGISNTIFLWGTTMDLNPIGYWYSVDWIQINIDLNITNAVINGSNNPVNPLYYNQNGINALEAVGTSTLNSSVSFGLSLGTVLTTTLDPVTFAANLANGLYEGQEVINAVPFITYLTANPNDYKAGRYAGFTIVYTPLRGFQSIVFNIIVTSFVV